MVKRSTGPEIERLIQLLAKLPGLGPRSARRAALHLIKNRDKLMAPLAAAMADARDRVTLCSQCGNADTVDPCTLCSDPRRDLSMICVVEEVGDLWALERAGAWSGLYHVLGGTLSAIEGVRPEDLAIAALVDRAGLGQVKEVVLALNAT
ncbi:MAG: recombination protein RecR, partial [Alphaproteobacteria bacterium]|nr:recombination protein RecR [Alphaproteobacteria bacterium]